VDPDDMEKEKPVSSIEKWRLAGEKPKYSAKSCIFQFLPPALRENGIVRRYKMI
jgi:hypothetical protein